MYAFCLNGFLLYEKVYHNLKYYSIYFRSGFFYFEIINSISNAALLLKKHFLINCKKSGNKQDICRNDYCYHQYNYKKKFQNHFFFHCFSNSSLQNNVLMHHNAACWYIQRIEPSYSLHQYLYLTLQKMNFAHTH